MLVVDPNNLHRPTTSRVTLTVQTPEIASSAADRWLFLTAALSRIEWPLYGPAVDTVTIVSLVIGAWGALLSSSLAWRAVRRDRRTLKVVSEVGYEVRRNSRGLQEVLAVTAINDAPRPIQVTRVVFWLSDAQPIHSMPPADSPQPELPAVLKDGEGVTLMYDWEAFRQIEKEEDRKVVSVSVYDATRGRYDSQVKPLRIFGGKDKAPVFKTPRYLLGTLRARVQWPKTVKPRR
jgi:hypothetical protein